MAPAGSGAAAGDGGWRQRGARRPAQAPFPARAAGAGLAGPAAHLGADRDPGTASVGHRAVGAGRHGRCGPRLATAGPGGTTAAAAKPPAGRPHPVHCLAA